MIIVKLEIRDIFDQCFQELVCGEKVIKALLRNRVLYTWVMSIKSNDVGNTHGT